MYTRVWAIIIVKISSVRLSGRGAKWFQLTQNVLYLFINVNYSGTSLYCGDTLGGINCCPDLCFQGMSFMWRGSTVFHAMCGTCQANYSHLLRLTYSTVRVWIITWFTGNRFTRTPLISIQFVIRARSWLRNLYPQFWYRVIIYGMVIA